MDSIVRQFTKGIHNVINSENIDSDACSDSKNWITKDGSIVLSNGRALVGEEGSVGAIRGLHFGYKTNGDKILFRKTETAIQYLDGETWTDIVTGLTSGSEYSFANYTSLSGYFVFISGADGFYKINTANPTSYIDLYDATKNDKGRIMIDKGRLLMWNCENASKTTLKLSYIDSQDSEVYTTVTGEAFTSLSGTLAFKAGGAKRNCFAPLFTITATSETYTDNKDGTLTGSAGGTGTINYITGAYTLSNAGVGTVSYQYEDSTVKGLADFTFSATRVASEGNRITQDIGGDAILDVEVSQDGVYYSLKEQSAYSLSLSADDDTFTNLVYRRDIGIKSFRAACSTSKGIVFMNTANPDNPELTILQRNVYGDNIEPYSLLTHFDFGKYDYSDCTIETFGKYIAVMCKSEGKEYNDTILLCSIEDKTVDVTSYEARLLVKNEGNVYVGSPITQSVYQVFTGFDDESYPISNYWISKNEKYSASISENLKKFKKIRIMGLIDPDQKIEVYESYDDAGFSLVGTIVGNGSYVDYSNPQTIGTNMIGDVQIGGNDAVSIYPFFCELKVKTPKFRKRQRMFVVTGIGYVSISMMLDRDILIFEQRIPKRFRNKQNVSKDGESTDLNNPE